jgi:D-3-phosphoglycerate dehydrogenase / 2-oxoglutarate reductase
VGKRVVVTDHTYATIEHERAAARAGGAELTEHRCTTEEETLAATAGADVVLVNFAPMTRAVLAELAPGATVIRYGVGYDNVDIAAADELGVRVANVPDYGTDTVADHAAALLLALLRRLPRADRAIREDGWCAPAALDPVRAFSHTVVGLLGTGRIGLALADRLRPFGFRLVAFDPYADATALAERDIAAVELNELLAEAHAISLHAPATPETHHVIGADTLARMRSGAVLVNTARGALVDEAALHDALASGRLGGAGLDVFEEEPPSSGSPLRGHPDVILTPHVAFYSDTSVEDLQRLAAEEAARALAGEPLRCQVNRRDSES